MLKAALSKTELKTAYKVISRIMEDNNLTKDNSFLRVKNWLSNKLCDMLIDDDINSYR